jgi:glyoxylase-like metal-dependent hydrolase (beta-lactamase superfamily II)
MTSADDIPFDRSPAAPSGEVVRLSPRVRRLIAPNKGPFTFTGTCTYIVGEGDVAVIDPGPDDDAHLAKLLAALRLENVEAILVTHSHRDHSPAARRLQDATGAPIIGCAKHVPHPDPPSGRADAGHDADYKPDHVMRDGETHLGDGFSLRAVATPGHASNHLAFALPEENGLFSGDHVMAWSTTIVAPPDGNMRDYMASLEKLRARDDAIYWPGHGGPVLDPQRFVRGLAVHRRQRETAILGRIAAGDRQIPGIVAAIYESLDPRLTGAACLSVLAHLEDLVARGLVRSDRGAATLEAVYSA